MPALTALAASTGRPVTEVATIGFAAAEHLRIGELKTRAGRLKIVDPYDRLAISGALRALDGAARRLTRDVLKTANGGAATFAGWAASHGQHLGPTKATLDEIAGSSDITVSRLTVAAGLVREAVGGG